jgi:hypothetical protein
MDLSKKAQLKSYIRDSSKTNHQVLRKTMQDCHDLWSTIIRTRDKYICQWCGGKNKTQAHHIVAQSLCSIIARYDKKNGMTLCHACHLHRLKTEPDEYIAMRDEWLAKRGLNYQTMRTIFCARSKTNISELEILKGELQKEAK